MVEGVQQDIRDSGMMFVHSSLDDAGLTLAQFRVYAHLARRAGADGAYPGIDSMASICQINKDTVISAIRALEEKGMIVCERKTGVRSRYILTRRSKWEMPDRPKSGNGEPSEMRERTVTSNRTPPSEMRERKGIHKGNPKKDIQRAPSALPFDSTAFLAAWGDWEKSRKEIGKPIRETARKLQLEKLTEMGETRAIAALKNSTQNSYQGIFEPSKNGSTLSEREKDEQRTGMKSTAGDNLKIL